MKFFPLTAFLFFVLSCSSPETGVDAPVSVTTPITIKQDSGLLKKQVSNPYAPTDVSPVDISYFPVDYPVRRMQHQGAEQPLARVIYSRPQRQNRTIFGSLLKYGEPWRLGANEATEIEFFKSVTIQNKTVPKGRYVLYGIPESDKWTIVFNSNVFSWGLKQDPKNDLFRFTIPTEKTPVTIEFFTMVFQPTDSGANLLMAWDDVVARLPMQF
jgi:hypothetical protein